MNRLLKLPIIVAMIWYTLPLLAQDFENTYEMQTLTNTTLKKSGIVLNLPIEDLALNEFPCETVNSNAVDDNLSGTTFTYDGFHYRVISDSDRTCEVVDWVCDHEPSKYDTAKPYLLNIPATTKHNGTDYKVVAIADDAFCYCSGCIGSLYTGDNVKRIGNNAFRNSYRLYSVTFGENLLEIGDNAFLNCKHLTKIDFADINTLTKIGANAFSGDVEITSPKNSTGFVFGKNLKEIGESAFNGCINLTNVDFSNVSNLIIGNNAFESCTTLPALEITSGIYAIGNSAFANTGIKRVSFKSPNTKIGECAFQYCLSLVDVSLPNSLDNFDFGVFNQCYALKSVIIPTGVTYIPEETFLRCTNLEDISLPLSLQSIGQYTFAETNISTIYLPKHLQKVGYGAFYKTPISLVVINQNATKIEDFAFYTDMSNKKPTPYATGANPPSLGQNVFYNPNNWNVYVNPDNKQQYLNATDDWCLFRNLNTYMIPTSITLSSTNLSMTAGEKSRLEITFNYNESIGNSSPLNVFWYLSSNPDIIHYDAQYGVAVMTSGNRDTKCELYFHTYFDNDPIICYINQSNYDKVKNLPSDDMTIDDELSIYDLQGRYIGNSLTDLVPAIYIVRSKSRKPSKIIIR